MSPQGIRTPNTRSCAMFFRDSAAYPSICMVLHLEGDCREILPSLPARSVQCALTSPPYWKLRNYLATDDAAKDLEIGREPTVREYIDNLVAVFREVSRVVMNDGT